MRDFLIRVSTPAQAKIALARYAAMIETAPAQRRPDGTISKPAPTREGFKLPRGCDYLPVDAYTTTGTPPVMDTSGATPRVLVPGVPPTKATGSWYLVSLDWGEQLPASAKSAVQAEFDREEGLKLPSGVVGLSTVWAGMKLSA